MKKIFIVLVVVLSALSVVHVFAQDAIREDFYIQSCGEDCYEFVGPVFIATEENIARGLVCDTVKGTATSGQELEGYFCHGIEGAEYKVTFKPSKPTGWYHKSCINGECSESTSFWNQSEKTKTYVSGGYYQPTWQMSETQ